MINDDDDDVFISIFLGWHVPLENLTGNAIFLFYPLFHEINRALSNFAIIN